jgi:hypothetical protein
LNVFVLSLKRWQFGNMIFFGLVGLVGMVLMSGGVYACILGREGRGCGSFGLCFEGCWVGAEWWRGGGAKESMHFSSAAASIFFSFN